MSSVDAVAVENADLRPRRAQWPSARSVNPRGTRARNAAATVDAQTSASIPTHGSHAGVVHRRARRTLSVAAQETGKVCEQPTRKVNKTYTHCPPEIEKAMKKAPAERKQTVVENLIRGGVCKNLLSHKHDHNTNDKLMSSCRHLLDSNYEQFHAALVNKEPKNLDIVLCYEQSTACVGVKRQSFEDSKATFTESDIDALLQDNKESVRIAQPIRSGSPMHSRDEL
ncbi:Hypothetical protein SMAX5B_020886 [Scophthalmus maximus]|nr:Hypothetical protein SMAX5B_020886 [Scophthalmus maximus]